MELRLWRPSNGSQGDSFMANFCEKCRNDTPDHPCRILTATMAFNINDPEYPKEWCYVDDRPTCTAFVDKSIPIVRRRRDAEGQTHLFPTESTDGN